MIAVTKIWKGLISLASIALLLIPASLVKAQEVDIGIFYYQTVPEVLISVNTGEYELWGDNGKIIDMPFDAVISVKINNSTLEVHGLSTNLGYYHQVYLKQVEPRSSLKVRALGSTPTTNVYDHEIVIKRNDKALRLINKVELNHYVAGVIEREIGPSANLEYYKIQAVMCRTYALGNLKRHAHQGFQLCDEVHCQAYSGQSTKNRKIVVATAATSDIVLADENNQLILAAYHSNCGGETMGSEKVWKTSKPYLQPVIDTFCVGMNSANWEMWIEKKDWDKYLLGLDNVDSLPSEPTCFYQEKREDDFDLNGAIIPIKKIRRDWRFRSSYFDIEEYPDGKLLVTGRGYGHGVGLCQQGALRMTQLGYKYRDVINFYFHGVKLLAYSSTEKNIEAME